MKLFDQYMIRQLLLALGIVAVTLTMLILLTQSLKFLEIIISSGASAGSFLMLMGLALPKFAEAVLPVSVMIACVFIYNKMISDSELIIARSAGNSPLALARPALVLTGVLAVLLLFLSAWVTPKSIAKLQSQRQQIQSEYASLLFREGVFNSVGSGLTVYIRKRNWNGEMEGLMIHDTRLARQNKGLPYTIIARRGVSLKSEEGQKVVVYDGVRQELDQKTGNVSRLDFSQYVIDIPFSQDAISKRWREPEERTMVELMDTANYSQADQKYAEDFMIEINRRFSTPILMLAFTVVSLCCLLMGELNRRGMAVRIVMAALSTLVLQGGYLVFLNLSRSSLWAVPGLYLIGIIPIIIGLFLLSPAGDRFRRSVFYGQTQPGRVG